MNLYLVCKKRLKISSSICMSAKLIKKLELFGFLKILAKIKTVCNCLLNILEYI